MCCKRLLETETHPTHASRQLPFESTAYVIAVAPSRPAMVSLGKHLGDFGVSDSHAQSSDCPVSDHSTLASG